MQFFDLCACGQKTRTNILADEIRASAHEFEFWVEIESNLIGGNEKLTLLFPTTFGTFVREFSPRLLKDGILPRPRVGKNLK